MGVPLWWFLTRPGLLCAVASALQVTLLNPRNTQEHRTLMLGILAWLMFCCFTSFDSLDICGLFPVSHKIPFFVAVCAALEARIAQRLS